MVVLWRESSRSELVEEFFGNSGGISRITCTISTGLNVDSRAIELFLGVCISLYDILRFTVALEHGRLH